MRLSVAALLLTLPLALAGCGDETTTSGDDPTPSAPTSTPHPASATPGRSTTHPAAPSSPTVATTTWSGEAGTVTVSCTGSTARVKGASPADGWHVEVDHGVGSEVEVTFHRNESEVQVKGTCVGGSPRLEAESDAGGGGDH